MDRNLLSKKLHVLSSNPQPNKTAITICKGEMETDISKYR